MCMPPFVVLVCLENPKLAYNTIFVYDLFTFVHTHSQKCEMREYEFATSIEYYGCSTSEISRFEL